MWRAEGKWPPKTSRKKREILSAKGKTLGFGRYRFDFANLQNYADETALLEELSDDHGNSNGSHVKIFLPKKLLECLPKCSSLPKERHRWNTNEVAKTKLFFFFVISLPGVLKPYT
ncbi:PREDICTED: calmodulin-binding transcription activator 1-like [Thamnophis sirtalis]|uniref:Calmodulin-binding transcription activator 1-like n=1 Tax=Thamnophis sirtalis TaxID=35019 RepID=A0A6I9Z084_9SAUR|nr:PREDICTED: calmodulin-binding transcription activator 1-like [Thamnophis sirtalis]